MLKRNPTKICQFLRRWSIRSPLQDTLRPIRRVLFYDINARAGRDFSLNPVSLQPLPVSPLPQSRARQPAAPVNRIPLHPESCISRNAPASPCRLCSHALRRSRIESSHLQVGSPSAQPCPPNIRHESALVPDCAAPSLRFLSPHELFRAAKIPLLPAIPVREPFRIPRC